MGLGVLTLCQCCALGKTQLKHIWKEQSRAKCHRPKQPLLCPSLSLGQAFCIESVLVVWHGLLQSKEFQHHNASPSLRNQVHKTSSNLMHGHQGNKSPFFFQIDDHNRATPGWSSSSFAFGFFICFPFAFQPACKVHRIAHAAVLHLFVASDVSGKNILRASFVQQTNYPANKNCTCPYFKPGQQTELGKGDLRYTIRVNAAKEGETLET